MRYLCVRPRPLIYATQPCDPLKVTRARCTLSRTTSQRINIQLCIYFAATATYHCKIKPLSHYVGAQSFLEAKSDSVKLWFTSYASVRNTRLLSIHTTALTCFNAITAVSFINIIVITCASVIFTPSSFPKQISLAKRNRFNPQPHAVGECLFFSYTSRCSSALTTTMATSVRAHIAPVPLARCAFVSQRPWNQVLLNCLFTVIQAHEEILNVCLTFLRLCTSVASAKCCNFC